MKSKQKLSAQLELFTAMNFVVVDPLLGDLSDSAGKHINAMDTMQRFAALHPDTIFSRLDQCKTLSKDAQQWELFGIPSMVTPKRLETFRSNMSCVSCGRLGNAFIVERHKNDAQHQYLNLYSIDDQSMQLMTVDHILPDSMGGRYDPQNFQTMCRVCNLEKRNWMSATEIKMVRDNPTLYAKTWVHLPLLDALLELQQRILKSTAKKRPPLAALLEKYTKLNKFGASNTSVKKATVALLNELNDTDRNFKEQSCLNVTPVAELDYTRDSWSARMKRWFVSGAEALAAVSRAAFSLRAANRNKV